jgi:hypothetical protein
VLLVFVDHATARSHVAAGTLKSLGVAALEERSFPACRAPERTEIRDHIQPRLSPSSRARLAVRTIPRPLRLHIAVTTSHRGNHSRSETGRPWPNSGKVMNNLVLAG